MTYTYTIYGLTLRVPFPCPMLSPAPLDTPPDITVVEGAVPSSLPRPIVEEERWQSAPGRFLLRGGLRSGRFLVECGERIILERNPAAEDKMLAAHLLSSVIAALLRQRGLLVLHANVATTPTGAIALSGVSGSGKSTTLAALLACGCSMLADDITALCLGQDGAISALPGVSKMSLCEDAAIRLGYDATDHPRNPLRRHKVIVPSQAAMPKSPIPLKTIYQLRRHSGDTLIVTALNGAEKFATLQECIYGPVFPEEHPGIFPLLTAISEQVDIVRIERPASHWSLDDVVGAILHG